MPNNMIRTYTVRLKPTKRQCVLLDDLLEHLCVLYNSALAERTRSWEEDKKGIGYNEQQSALTQFRQCSPEVAKFPFDILSAVNDGDS